MVHCWYPRLDRSEQSIDWVLSTVDMNLEELLIPYLAKVQLRPQVNHNSQIPVEYGLILGVEESRARLSSTPKIKPYSTGIWLL